MDGRLLVDVFYYNSVYQDFGAEIDVTQAYSIPNGLTGSSAIPVGYTTSEGAEHAANLQQVFVEEVRLALVFSDMVTIPILMKILRLMVMG